jgi:hypothetical protein
VKREELRQALYSLPVHTELFKPLTTLVRCVKLLWAEGVMALSTFVKEILLLDSTNLKLKRKTKKGNGFMALMKRGIGWENSIICTGMQDFIPMNFMTTDEWRQIHLTPFWRNWKFTFVDQEPSTER